MAREAGFHTTWISNQSRFGIWDTPIGAIGSACDDQYWINQYVGTDVITKDYDTVLVPYLKKVDPNNRRQLIVIHLMGSHVSYWTGIRPSSPTRRKIRGKRQKHF